jgi:hypothetical protein
MDLAWVVLWRHLCFHLQGAGAGVEDELFGVTPTTSLGLQQMQPHEHCLTMSWLLLPCVR